MLHRTFTDPETYAGDVVGNNGVRELVVALYADGPPPPLSITCPSNITATACSTNGVVVDYTVTVNSGWYCQPITLVSVPPSGSVFPIGTTTVTNSVTDSCGESNYCTFTVTVSLVTPLTITCPTNVTVTTCDTSGAVVNYAAPTVGGGLPPCTSASVPPSGSLFPLGTNTVTCSVTDSCGQSNYCIFTVTVMPPPLSITCPTNINVVVASSNALSIIRTNPLPVGISRRGSSVTLTWSNSAPNPTGAVITYAALTVSGGCSPITSNWPPSGSTFPIGTNTVTCSVTDAVGQSNYCSFTVTVSVSPWTYSIYRTNNMYRAWITNWPKILTGYPAGGSSAAWLSYTDTTATATTNFYRISVP